MKVLYMTNIPSPYRVDFFNELAKYCELTVTFERKGAKDRDKNWGGENNIRFKSIFLRGLNIGTDAAYCKQVKQVIIKDKYDIIIVGGYSTPTGMLAIKYLNRKKIPFVLNCDGGIIKNDNRLKYIIKKYFISSAEAWLSTGNNTNEYLLNYGAKGDNIYIYPFTSINERDISGSIKNSQEKKKLRDDLKITEERVVLCVGRFIYIKGVDLLISASKELDNNIGVYIVGGQPTEEYIYMKNAINAKNIHFVDFKSKEDLKRYYYAADIFVLPTRGDIWGLVINEAMAYGLPVITTNKCVAGMELIKDSKNGFIIPIDDEKSLAEKIMYIINNEKIRINMANNNLRDIKKYTIENMAKEHMKIFNEIIKRR